MKEYGFEKYMEKIEELKGNKKYFKYFNSLNIINKHVKTSEEAEKAIGIIQGLGIASLNIDLSKFPLWEFNDCKDLQRFLSIENNNIMFNPNTRFKILIKYFFEEKELKLDENKNINLVDCTTYGSNDITILCRETIKKIYKSSMFLNRIIQRIECIDNNNGILVSSEYASKLLAYPTEFTKDYIKVDRKLANIDTIIKLLNDEKNSVLRFEHALAGWEDITLLSYWPLDKHEICSGRYNLKDMTNILSKIENPIVFVQSKLFERNSRNILKYLNFRPVFILMENSIGSTLPFIYREFRNSKYSILKDSKYDILVIIKEDVILINLLVKNMIEDFSKIFSEDKNIAFVDSSEISMVNQILIRKIANSSFIFAQYIHNTEKL